MRHCALFFMLGLVLACQSTSDEDPTDNVGEAAKNPPATGPTWHGGVKQLVAAHCSSCHQPGEVAPFALTNFQ